MTEPTDPTLSDLYTTIRAIDEKLDRILEKLEEKLARILAAVDTDPIALAVQPAGSPFVGAPQFAAPESPTDMDAPDATDFAVTGIRCRQCNSHAPTKAAIVHSPNCPHNPSRRARAGR